MNPFIAFFLALLVAGAILSAGVYVGMWFQCDREFGKREVLERRASDLEKALVESQRVADEYQKLSDRAVSVSTTLADKLQRLLLRPAREVSEPVFPGDTVIPDPPTTNQADRKYLEARRKERESTSDTRIPLRVSDGEAPPTPQLRDADDNH